MSGSANPAYTHGHTVGAFSPEYHSWSSMIQRCTNSKRRSYQHYGGRGIKVCDRWLKFENFLADMGPRPPNTTLDRVNNDKDYTPQNCRWADTRTQARNSSQAVRVTISGVTRLLLDWCEQYQISVNTVRHRVKYHGMSYVCAITTPKQSQPGRPVTDCEFWTPKRTR